MPEPIDLYDELFPEIDRWATEPDWWEIDRTFQERP